MAKSRKKKSLSAMLSPLLGQISLIFDTDFGEWSGDRYLNHLYTIEKWYVQQESIQIAESITLY